MHVALKIRSISPYRPNGALLHRAGLGLTPAWECSNKTRSNKQANTAYLTSWVHDAITDGGSHVLRPPFRPNCFASACSSRRANGNLDVSRNYAYCPLDRHKIHCCKVAYHKQQHLLVARCDKAHTFLVAIAVGQHVMMKKRAETSSWAMQPLTLTQKPRL